MQPRNKIFECGGFALCVSDMRGKNVDPNKKLSITIGKTYKVLSNNPSYFSCIKILNDKGYLAWYNVKHFIKPHIDNHTVNHMAHHMK